MAKTQAEIFAGEDMEGGEKFCDGYYNLLKNHWRAAAAPGTPSPGMLFSDEDDEKLYHRWAASWGEVVQGDVPLTDELAVIVGTNSDGSFYYDETTNDEVVIEARAHADTEGITISLLETNQRFRLRQNSDVMFWYLDGTDAFMQWSDGQLEFQTDETNAQTVLRIRPNGTSEASELHLYDADGLRLALFTTADRGFLRSVGGALGINNDGNQNVNFFESAGSGETPELIISGFRAADALRSLEIGVGVDAADTASFGGLSNYYFDGMVGIGIIPTTSFHVRDAGTLTIRFEAFTDDIHIDLRPGLDEVGIEACDFRFFDANVVQWTIGKNTGNDFIIYDEVGGSTAIKVVSSGNIQLHPAGGNVGLATLTFGTNADHVFAVANGTAPTTSPANISQMWSADVLAVAGKAGPHQRSEEGGMKAWHGGAGTINSFTYQADVADDGSFTLPAITDSAWGFIQAGDNEEYAFFMIDNDGDVTLISNSANVVANADTDGKFCLGIASPEEPLTVKNRLGAQKNINLIIWYS